MKFPFGEASFCCSPITKKAQRHLLYVTSHTAASAKPRPINFIHNNPTLSANYFLVLDAKLIIVMMVIMLYVLINDK